VARESSSFVPTINCYISTKDKPEEELSPASEETFEKVKTRFKAALLSVVWENIIDPIFHFYNCKDMWDVLEAKFGGLKCWQ
jgi:hypothetical protein